jgi:2-methylcitrate dehydratase
MRPANDRQHRWVDDRQSAAALDKEPSRKQRVSKIVRTVLIFVTPERFYRGPDSDSPGFPLQTCGNDGFRIVDLFDAASCGAGRDSIQEIISLDNITRQIAEYSSAARYDALTADCVHAAVQRLIDSLGCAVGAHACEPAQIGRKLAHGQTPGKYAGRVLCFGERVPAEAATFINSAMIRNFDFNDRYPGGHPSDCLGALLALAGAMAVDGKSFLASMAVIYEIFARLSDATMLSRRGWDQGYAIGIATAAGVANLLNLPFEATAHAIGIAATSNLPLRVTRSGELTVWKNVATAYAARNGLFAALLAAEGMSGPGSAFEGRNGLWEKVTGPFELAPFPDRGGAYLTPRVQLKYWPIETNGQAAVWAALELRAKVDPMKIESIDVFASKFTWFEIGSEPEKWDPQTRETADHSLPYIFARALVDGPIRVSSFEDEAVRDPALRPLMQKIKVIADDAIEALLPQKTLLRVAAGASDGSRHSVEIVNPLGHPDNPMQDAHIEEKFLALAEPVLGARARAALHQWWSLPDAADIAALIQLLDLKAAA